MGQNTRFSKFVVFSLFFLLFLSFASAEFTFGGSESSVSLDFYNNYSINGTEILHNNLSDLQGGTTGEYYHIRNSWFSELGSDIFDWLTSDEIDSLGYFNSSYFPYTHLSNFSYDLVPNNTFLGNISIGTGSSSDNDYIFFDSGSKSLFWDDVSSSFNFSSNLNIASFLNTGDNIRAKTSSPTNTISISATNDVGASSSVFSGGSSKVGTLFGLPYSNLSGFSDVGSVSVYPSAIVVGTYSDTPLVFGTNNLERFRVTSDGYLGVNLTSPQNAFNVYGVVNITGLGSGLYFPDGSFLNTSTISGISIGTLQSYFYNGTNLNKTYTDTLYKNLGIQTWNDTYSSFNESYADTLYLSSYTESDPLWTANQSLYYLNSNPFSFWNDTYSTFNKTYADTLYSLGSSYWNISNVTYNSTPASSGNPYTQSHGETLDTSGSVSSIDGLLIQMNATYNSTPVSLYKVTKHSSSTSTTAYLSDNGSIDGGHLIASASFVGDVATFSNISLTAGNVYYVLAGSGGSSYTRRGAYPMVGSYPFDNLYLDWISGFANFENSSVDAFNIVSVTLSVGSSSASNFSENFLYTNESVYINGTLGVFAHDFITLSRLPDFDDSSSSLDKLSNYKSWRDSNGNLIEKNHYAYVDNGNVAGLSVETRLVELEKMVYELNTQLNLIKSETCSVRLYSWCIS